MTVKTELIDYALLGKRVAERYPWIVAELLSHPDIEDISLVPEIFKSFTEGYPISVTSINKKKLTEFRNCFIAVVIKLYDPDMIAGDKTKMKNKLREEISEVLKMHPNQISDNLKIVRTYLKCNAEFSIRVNYFYNTIKNTYCLIQSK